MIADKIVDTPGALELVTEPTKAGKLELVMTHVQEDEARLGDEEPFESLRGTVRHTADGMIAATAEFEGIPLVTEERRLARRAHQLGIEVWSWERLRERMCQLAAS
jgi:hypothetical protein